VDWSGASAIAALEDAEVVLVDVTIAIKVSITASPIRLLDRWPTWRCGRG
jgi:hypothetical protein